MCVYDAHKYAEINRNALVPVQFSASLHRETSTNSTASSTSDVSRRSNPDVPSYSSNTNMWSQISSVLRRGHLDDSSMFYVN
jgi:hypothetical protein